MWSRDLPSSSPSDDPRYAAVSPMPAWQQGSLVLLESRRSVAPFPRVCPPSATGAPIYATLGCHIVVDTRMSLPLVQPVKARGLRKFFPFILEENIFRLSPRVSPPSSGCRQLATLVSGRPVSRNVSPLAYARDLSQSRSSAFSPIFSSDLWTNFLRQMFFPLIC